MFLRCFIVFLVFSVNVLGDTLETIRQQFEIYQRYAGEIEILSADNIKEIDNVLQRTEAKRQTARSALDNAPTVSRPKTDGPSPLLAEGYGIPFLHYIAVERAFAQRSLQQGKPDDTMQSIHYVYRLADELSGAGSLELRTVAALIRLQTLEIVQSFVLNPHCLHEHHQLLLKLFDGQTSRESGDKTIWVRYREEGKRFFEETARIGLNKTVSPNLLRELRDRSALDEYNKAPVERFFQDQSVFHHAMEAVIESCSLPFYQRQPFLRRFNRELKEKQGTASEPVFTLLLLRDVSGSMQLFAQEQSGCEIAYLALSASLNGQNRRRTMNFLTGNEYEFRLIPDGILCTYEGNVKPFYVPHR